MTNGSELLRLAVATGAMHLPRMNFVVAQAAAMAAVDARVFAVAADRSDLTTLSVHQNLERLPLPYSVRRRSYALSRVLVGRKLARWQPHVINLHFLPLGGFAVSHARRHRTPLVTTVHAIEPFLIDDARSLRERFLRRECERVLEESTSFLAVSDYIADWMLSLGVERRRVRTNYIGIDTDFWTTGTTPVERLAEQRVLFVGNLTTLKGIDDLVAASSDARAEVPHQLDVVGDGPLRDELERSAGATEHLHVHGLLDREAIRSLLERTTVLVLPTRPHLGVSEAAPTVLLEAQSMGVPVLTFDVGGTPEVVATRDFLVTSRDRDGLAESIRRMLIMPASDYDRLGRTVRDWVVRNRSIGLSASLLRETLEMVALRAEV